MSNLCEHALGAVQQRGLHVHLADRMRGLFASRVSVVHPGASRFNRCTLGGITARSTPAMVHFRSMRFFFWRWMCVCASRCATRLCTVTFRFSTACQPRHQLDAPSGHADPRCKTNLVVVVIIVIVRRGGDAARKGVAFDA